MSNSLLEDAFDHHVWATLRLLDACEELSREQLEASAVGTYGSVLDTMRHLVGGDCWYLLLITGDPAHRIDEDQMALGELRAVIEADGRAWSSLLAQNPDQDAVVRDVDEEGIARDATIGIRLAQALHHGSEHRSQICTVLTTLGVEPPSLDVWDYGLDSGRVVETLPAT
jgi:uncharacterized damage-inducible protein DinB